MYYYKTGTNVSPYHLYTAYSINHLDRVLHKNLVKVSPENLLIGYVYWHLFRSRTDLLSVVGTNGIGGQGPKIYKSLVILIGVSVVQKSE